MDMDKIGKVIERPFGRSLISFILILTILLGFLPTTAFAAETMTVSDPDALEQIGTITIEGNDYNLYRLVVDTVQYNAIEFSDASSCAITTVVPVMGKKPAAIGATNLINVAPDSENYSKGEALYQSSISSNLSEEILDGLRTDTDKLGYYLYTVKRGKINTIIGVLILEWPEASQEVEGANKDELQRVIARAGLISSSDYYQAEDYYNGKTTSSDGFWQDFQTALKTAKEILDNITATQEDVNGATASLNAAIANLIPANQVNATVLYEAIQEVESRGYRQEDYTPETWTAYKTVYEKGKAYLASLYDQDGNPTTENKAEHQDTVEQYAEELLAAAGGLDAVYNGGDEVTSASIYQRSLAGMLAQFAGALEHESGYTEESFTAFRTAYQEAQSYYRQHGLVGTSVSASVLNGYQRHAAALWSAYYEGLESAKETISVSLCVADSQVAYDLTSPDGAELGLAPEEGVYESPAIALSGGNRTVAGLIESAGLQLQVKNNTSPTSNRQTTIAIFINGVQLRDAGLNPTLLSGVTVDRTEWSDIKLRDGDEVVILFAPAPMDREYSAMGVTAYANTTDFWGLLSFEDHAETVAEGEALTLKVTRTGGWVGSYDGRSAPFNGARLLAVKLDESGAPSGEYQLLEGITDASGTVTTHLNEAGQYVLVAANPESVIFDQTASGAQHQYASLNAPARTTVTVTPLNEEELAAAKEARKSLLAAALAGCNATELGEAVYAQVQAAHDAGVQAIEDATSLKAAEDALSNALTQIESLVENAEKSNEESVSAMRKYLAKLPTVAQIGEGLFLQSDISTMQEASSHYAGMTGYQKSQLTGQEQAQWEALVEAYGEDGSNLPEKTFTLTFEFIGQEGSSDPFKSFLALKNKGFRYANVIELSPNDEWWVYIRTETGTALNELDYEIYRVESTGATLSELRLDRPPTDPKGGYNKGWEGVAPFYFADSTSAFMPRNDVTITFYIRGKTSVESLRSSALDQLSEAFNGYKRSDYSDTNWKTLTSAYDEGVSKINAAENAEAIETALSDALNAMKAVETRVSSGEFGSVHVTVENTTYADGSFYQNGGAFVEAEVELYSDTTMMTAVLEALSENGYGWNNGNDTSVTYIENIYKDVNQNGQWDNGEAKLAAFDGSVSSGWMGVLNDWFTNYGFSSYAVSNTDRDYRLVDGDEIRVMFTMDGYGDDLGGTWGNGDTSLKELEVTGGTLSPSFDGETTSYALTLDGGDVSVTPTAANKNFLVKTFINNKTTANNVEYYRRGENLPVQPGDTIYIGVGEYKWPSMNNQSGNTLRYTGTWYTIQVCESGAKGIQARIDDLPDKSEITYSNYKSFQQTVSALQADYNALPDKSQVSAAKLTAAAEQIQFFAAIDSVKTQIADLPTAVEITENPEAHRSKVEAAKTAYEALGISGQLYLKAAEVARLNEAVEALGGSISPDDVAAVQAFNDLVEAIGEKVSAGSKDAIVAARTAYENLTDAQKALVATAPDSYNTLLNAEAALPVVERIAGIGTVTLESEAAITAARQAYTDYAGKFSGKDMVSNLNVLEAAEAALEILQGGGQDTSGYREVMNGVLEYLEQNVKNPIVGSTKGEWAVLAQARAGTLSEDVRAAYLANLADYVETHDGILDTSKNGTMHTEYARVVVTLTALGMDATQFQVSDGKTYNLVKPLLDEAAEGSSYTYQVSEQGNNGTIWALIALNSGDYYRDEAGNTARAAWIDLLIDKQQSNGNWPIYNPDQENDGSGSQLGGVDVCAMALQALAPYYLDAGEFNRLGTAHSHEDLQSAVKKALDFLSTSQNSTGGYGSSESSAQVIVALAALKKDAGSFAKGSISVLADLLGYRKTDGGFSHTSDGPIDQMSTEQAAYALVAYDRYKNNKKPLYDMSDVFDGPTDGTDTDHTIHASADAGGTISPVGDVTVPDGAKQSFTVTPNEGYQIEDILVDGKSVWAGGATVAQKLEPPEYQLPTVPVEDVEPEACADGIHVGENVVIGQRAATCTEPGYTGDTICGACGEVLEQGAETRTVPHQYGGAWQMDETSHWQVCQICGAKSSAEPHVFEQTEEPAPPELEFPEQGGATQKPTTGEETEAPGAEPEMPDADGQQPEETEGQDPDTIPPEGESDPEVPAPGEETGEDSANENEPPAEEQTKIPESAEAPASDESQPDINPGSTGGELVSVVGIHPMLLMSVGAGLPQTDGTAEPHAEGSACQVCGYSPETGGTAACSHSGGTATCTALASCDLCGQSYGDYAQHAFTETAHSSGVHWNVCAACGLEELSSLAPHSWELDAAASTETISVYVCPDCGAERTEAESAAPTTAANALVTSADSKSYTYTFENVTEDHAISVTFEKPSPVIVQEVTINGNTQTAVIDEAAVQKAVEAVTASAADTITIIPTADSSSISSVSVELPAGAAQTISEANAGVEIQTSRGTVTLPANVLGSIAQKETDGEKLSIHVEEKSHSAMEDIVPDGTNLAGSVAVEVSVRVGSTELTSFGGHDLTLTIPVDNSFTLSREYKVLVISDNGSHEILTGTCRVSDSGRVVSISVNHLSTFIVLAETTAQTFTITATAGGNGDIDPFGSVEVDAGEDQIFHITPDNGYEIATLRVDGKTVDLDELYIRSDGSASYTFYDVDASHSIRATFQRGTEIPDFGPVVGEVYISIENNTYWGGDFTGTLASGWYDLCAEDTMMTIVLKALALDGYSWWGTGASDTGGYDITYLSGIYMDKNGNGRRDNSEPSLAEFDGSRGAGWMGTLNDWFVNEGFQSFRVGGRGTYELADGDYLNIVFTQNLGEDVGSLWGNSDTSLEDLHISGGTLAPRFDGDTLEYTLSITGNSARVTVTPTAVNKNYMVKTFLNRYNRDSAFYKRTESITVKPGDILYIGVGDPSWPSMNNQSTEAIDYEGTKYTITVVNGNSAEAVIGMIKAVPEITYANYKTQASKVSAARAAYDALTQKAKAEISQTLLNKLEAAEEKIEFYEKIDAAKKLLKELPAVNKNKVPTSSLIRQVRKAADAYEKLNSKQREYITAEDAGRYEALRLWLIESGAVGQNELPVIDGSLTLPEQDGVEVVLEPKASVDNSGNASAAVTAADLNKLLDEALEAEASVLVIAPTGAEQASAISVELPRCTLDNALDETNADLAVRTPLGELSMPNLTLARILSGAGGQDLTVNMARRTISQAEALLNGRADVTEEQMSGASVVEVSLTSGNKSITSFGGRSITLLLPVNAGAFQAGQACTVYQISGGGAVEKLAGVCLSRNGGLWVKVSTTQLGTFVAVPPEQPVQLPFTDVREGDWFYDAVAYAYTNELFNGTSATTFSPNGTMTRAMLVTALWRLEGEPAAAGTSGFPDVKPDAWYTEAVDWASQTDIVSGTGAGFDPEGSVTREQIASILYRYAKLKGWDVSKTANLQDFADGTDTSAWATRAMEWAYAEKLITGKDGKCLDPQGQASRAEVATILMRLLESKAKNA